MAAELPILQCTLDAQGAREQGARYAEVAAHVESAERADRSLVAVLDAGADTALVDELVAAERACCSFFTIGWERGRRRLSFGVADARHAPALDVIAEALRI